MNRRDLSTRYLEPLFRGLEAVANTSRERSVRMAVVIGCVLSFGACGKTVGANTNEVLEVNNTQPETKVAAPSPVVLQTAELMVEGTSCASCAVTIRRHLHKLQGIGEIREGSTKQHLLVEFDPQLVTTEQLVNAVSEAGYEAEVLVHAPGVTPARAQGG